MQLVGMLDSPYVRRVAISMKLMGIDFVHRPVSAFRHFDTFREVNPVVKAPTLVCDDGVALMDSTLILDYLESPVPPARRLMPPGGLERREALRLIGFALAGCDKCVALVYEREQRPAPTAADVAVAVAWRFAQYTNAELLPAWKFPALARYSVAAEGLPAFVSTPLD